MNRIFVASTTVAQSTVRFWLPIFAAIVCIPSIAPSSQAQSFQARSFGQPRDQPHVNAPVEKRVTWELLRAMPTHLKRTLPSPIRNLRHACSGWGGVKIDAQNIDGTVTCVQDQQSTVNYNAYRNFGTDYVAASVLVSLHTAIQVDPERRSQLIADFQQPNTLQRLVDQGVNHSLRVGFPLVQSSRQQLVEDAQRVVLKALQDPNWDRSLYGSVADYEVLSQSFCNAQGLSQKQAQLAATRLQGYQLYATCWMEFGLPSQMVRDFRIAKHLTNPKAYPLATPVPIMVPIDSTGSRVTPKNAKTVRTRP